MSFSSTISVDSPPAWHREGSHVPMQNKRSEIVKLNVGGAKFVTTIKTLCSVDHSYFSLLFNGRWTQLLTDEGEVFIDRDGELFRFVLQYLRSPNHSGSVILPLDQEYKELLAEEARFYNIPGLEALLVQRKPRDELMAAVERAQMRVDMIIDTLPFNSVRNLIFSILSGERRLTSAWTLDLDPDVILLNIISAQHLRMTFTVVLANDMLRLEPSVTRMKVLIPDRKLEKTFGSHHELYFYSYKNCEELMNIQTCVQTSGARHTLLKVLNQQDIYEVSLCYGKRERMKMYEYELYLDFHKRGKVEANTSESLPLADPVSYSLKPSRTLPVDSTRYE